MARWVVIGGTGYIGEALCRYLQRAGHRVVSVSRSSTGPQLCEHLPLNLFPETDFSRLFLPGDRVVYAAGLANRGRCERAPELAQWLNSDCPAEMLRHASAAGAYSFTYLSSVKAMVPPAGVLADESSGTPAKDIYGHSKWLGEQQLLAQQVGCRVNLIRPAAVYGNYRDGRGAGAGSRAQRVRRLLRIWGRIVRLLPATGRRSFVSLEDLLSAIEVVALGGSDRQVYIAAEPQFYDIPGIALAACGVPVRGSRLLTRLLLTPLRPLRRLHPVRQLLELEQSELYSAARLRGALSWRPRRRYSEYLQGVS